MGLPAEFGVAFSAIGSGRRLAGIAAVEIAAVAALQVQTEWHYLASVVHVLGSHALVELGEDNNHNQKGVAARRCSCLPSNAALRVRLA